MVGKKFFDESSAHLNNQFETDMNYIIHTPSAARLKKEILDRVSEKLDANGKGITSKSTEGRILSIVFFLLPLSFLGSGPVFSILRVLLFMPIAFVVFFNYKPSKSFYTILFLLFYSLLFMFIMRKGQYGALLSFFLLVSICLLFFNYSTTIGLKKQLIKNLYIGCLIAGLVGFAYMVVTGIYIKGGAYTPNLLNISNLTVPFYLCIYIIFAFHNFVSNIKRKWHILFVILGLFSIVLFLDKRGPILFCIVSIVLSFFIISSWLKKTILLVTFAFVLYEIPIMSYVAQNNSYVSFLERTNDFGDVDNNPRIVRLYAANSFITDFKASDLIGYHTDLFQRYFNYDKAHSHFHNTLLQLYYERGLLSVILVFILLLCLSFPKQNTVALRVNYATLLYMFLVGTHEDLLMTGTPQEFLSMTFLMLTFPLNEYEKNH